MISVKNNFFISDEIDRKRKGKRTRIVKIINKTLGKLKLSHQLVKTVDASDMNSIEQRINFFHLLNTVIDNNVEGDIVEFGVYIGETALLFQKILQFKNSTKKLHLYDTFDLKFNEFEGNVSDALITNFKKNNLELPVLHKGFFQDTFPTQLPDKIAFAHIDCGIAGNVDLHKEVMDYCFKELYPRLSKGGICMLMDYDPLQTTTAVCPAVRISTDAFLADKPEELISLYGNTHFHAYFKKV